MRAGRSEKNGAISAATERLGISLADAAQILLARLLDDSQPRTQAGIEPVDRGGHDIRHDPRALAAAEDEETQRIARRRIGRCRRRDHRRPQRIAGQCRFGGHCRRVAEHVGKGRCDRGDARRQKTIGASDDGVGIVNEARHAAPDRGQNRRQRRITAEADDGRGLEPADQLARLIETRAERGERFCHRDRIARSQSRAGDNVDRVVGESAAKARGAPIGHQMNRDAALASAAASASAGNKCPPVPPAATSTGAERAAASIMRRPKIRRPGRQSEQIVAFKLGARPLARQRHQHAHAVSERDQRRTAIGHERQCHSLGRHQMQIDRHIDGRLQPEQDRKPRCGETDERVVGAHRLHQRADHNERKQRRPE